MEREGEDVKSLVKSFSNSLNDGASDWRGAVFFACDEGIGFDARYADNLFGVSERLHSAEESNGTGIGLANVRCIVHRRIGSVWAGGQGDHLQRLVVAVHRVV